MLKPVVFLCHSKKDKDIIIRIANDLRACRIDPWYDEWEIPAGKSFQDKIFRDGIPQCDCFFIYLTASSIGSYWVNKELDAAFVEQSKAKLVDVITFVDSEETRNKLRSDIQSLHSPIINDDNYEAQFKLIVAAIFEARINQIRTIRNYEANYEAVLFKHIKKLEIKDLRRQLNETEKRLFSVRKSFDEKETELFKRLSSSQDKLSAARRELAGLAAERNASIAYTEEMKAYTKEMENELITLRKENKNRHPIE